MLNGFFAVDGRTVLAPILSDVWNHIISDFVVVAGANSGFTDLEAEPFSRSIHGINAYVRFHLYTSHQRGLSACAFTTTKRTLEVSAMNAISTYVIQ